MIQGAQSRSETLDPQRPERRFGALDFARAIRDANLTRVEQAVALALLAVVKNETWWSPWEGPSAPEGGVAVATLAQSAKYSPRHTRRGLVALEARGLLQIVFRSWRPSAYRLVAEAWTALAAERKGMTGTGRGLRLAELLELEPEERAEVSDLPAGELKPPPVAWALTVSRRFHLRLGDAEQLVRGAVAHLAPDAPDAEQLCALEAVRIAGLWAKAGRPKLERFLEQLAAVGEAARVCQAPHWSRVRGAGVDEGPIDPMKARAAVAQARPKEDRSQSLRTLLRAAAWGDHVREALAHQAGACRYCSASSSAEPDQAPITSAEGWQDGRWIPDGQDGAVQAPADLVAWWNRCAARLVDVVGLAEWKIWIGPLEAAGVVGGLLWLRVPNTFYAEHVAERWLYELRELVGGPVAFVLRE